MTELSKIKIHYKISLVGCIKNSCGESYRLRWDMEENNGWLRTAIRLWKSLKIRPANLTSDMVVGCYSHRLARLNTNWAHLRRSFQAAHSPEALQRKMFVPNICLTMTMPRKSSRRFFNACRQCIDCWWEYSLLNSPGSGVVHGKCNRRSGSMQWNVLPRSQLMICLSQLGQQALGPSVVYIGPSKNVPVTSAYTHHKSTSLNHI